MTADWKSLLRQALLDEGMTQHDLAERLGVSDPAITTLFKPTTKTSALVDPICEMMSLPGPEFLDRRDAEVTANLRLLRQQSPSEYDDIAARIADRLKRIRANN